MTEITFNDIPKIVSQLSEKLNNIERLLLSQDNNQPSEENRFLSIKEAAEFIGLSVPTVYGLVHRKNIPCMKRNKRLYFSKQQLISWIKEGRKMTVSEIQSDARNSLSKIGRGHNG